MGKDLVGYTTAEIAERVGGRLTGPADLRLTGVAEVRQAGPTDLTFLGDAKVLADWRASQAGATLVSDGIDAQLDADTGRALIHVASADLALASVLDLYAPPPAQLPPGIHPSAHVDPSAQLGQDVTIGPQAYIGPHAVLGDRCTLHPGAAVYDHAQLGTDCVLWRGVVIRERCVLGDRCTIHPGAVIGADGFGYRPAQDAQAGFRFVKVPQIGIVRIGDDCEIGANATIDRAKVDTTVLGRGCKIDNLVQIGHNCRLGDHVVIAGCTGIGGSCTIGDATVIGGACDIADHLHIGSRVQLAGGSQLMNDIPDGETWFGSPAASSKTKFKEELAIRKLPELIKLTRKYFKDGDP